jgi:hypothetical protein
MSDNLRRYRAIRAALLQGYPGQPTGTIARHLTTLAALMSGIVGSKSTPLPHIATKVPDGTKPESRVTRLARWCDKAHILEEMSFLPYADVLLRHLALQTVGLVMDGSGVGRGCPALMLHVGYTGRALPLAWRVRHAPKGPLARRPPYRLSRTHPWAEPRGRAGGVAGRWGMRWDAAAAHAAAGGRVLRVPHGHEHRGDVGKRDLPPGCARRVSQTGQADRVQGGARHTRSVWSHPGAMLWG